MTIGYRIRQINENFTVRYYASTMGFVEPVFYDNCLSDIDVYESESQAVAQMKAMYAWHPDNEAQLSVEAIKVA